MTVRPTEQRSKREAEARLDQLPKGLELEHQVINKVYERWHAATERFDYFVTGGTGALCAFVAQTAEFGRIGLNPSTLELVALLTMLGSVAAGFMTIERMNDGTYYNHLQLYHESRARYLHHELNTQPEQPAFRDGASDTVMSRDDVQRSAKASAAKARQLAASEGPMWNAIMRWQAWRNGLLGCGFLMLIAARVWMPYAA